MIEEEDLGLCDYCGKFPGKYGGAHGSAISCEACFESWRCPDCKQIRWDVNKHKCQTPEQLEEGSIQWQFEQLTSSFANNIEEFIPGCSDLDALYKALNRATNKVLEIQQRNKGK